MASRNQRAMHFGSELVAVAIEHVLELDAEAASCRFDEGGAVLCAVPDVDYVDAIDIEGCRREGGIRHRRRQFRIRAWRGRSRW